MKIFYFKLNRHIISVLLGLVCATPLFAQTGKTVTGTVKDHNHLLSGVVVTEEGTQNSVRTDANGYYSLTLQHDDAKLIFEQLDFPIREEEVLNRSVINVSFIKEDGIQLKDVVINAGYYAVKDKERTGSIARVTAKEIENQPVNSVLDALQGRVPGLEITPTSGVAGGGYTIRIRGQNSIAAGNNPLFIVDGVPFDTNSMGDNITSGGLFLYSSINPLNYIDPQSIESIEVLKDADATAIYGSRGANGVLLITTKKGKAKKTSISIDASTTVINATKLPKLLTTEQHLEIRKKAFANDGVTTYPTTAYDINGTWDQTRYTDWQKLLIGNTAFNHNIRTSINGGNEQTNFMIGANVMKETSVFYGDYAYNKLSFFSTLNHKTANNKLKLQWTTNYGQDKNYLPTQDLTRIARTLVPNAPRLFNEDGSLNWENNTWTNPLAALNASYRNNTRNLNTNLNTSYQLMDNIVLRSNVGYNRSDLDDSQLNPHTIRNPAFGATSLQSSNMTKNSGQHEGWLIEPQLDANFNLTASSKLSVLIGGTLNSQTTTKLVILADGFTDNKLINVLSAAKDVMIYKDTEEQYKYAALYGRVNYNLHEKYFFNLTGRRDGSSRFGPNHRFSNFGAVGAAWMFSKESFLRDVSWLSFGKLRGSYGVTGNDQIGDYQYLNTYNISQNGYDGNILLTTARLYNPDFSWEKNKKLEFALETAFLKNRINLTLNYYQNRSNNQLVGYSLPAITGFTSIQANLNAVVENKGWEMDLQVVPIKSAKFNWSTSFNLTIPKNRLVAFEGLENTSYANSYVIGKSLNSKKIYHFEGINPTTGLYEFTDYNGDGKITAIEDKQQVVSLDPSFYGGFFNSISYENFNIDIFFQFSKKKGFNEFYNYAMPGTMSNQPLSVVNGNLQNYSSGSNSNATLAYSNYINSDAIVTDTSFIRLKNVSLSYKLPLSKNQSNQYVIYAQGQNLWTWSKYKYGDPEQTTGFLPPLRRVSIGFKANF
ncbi:SusC/RagA family TonB-linked outer membrane protein [Empedobacter sp. GD03861]|uniref:SusC/RagA family TonB-linked outer membrane protein n=1 Tax=Empedobacter sp. GD03861 TaxID=2975390 RepID=UPI002449BE8A|nr:SusC/RagA family TonB-linked outer membrane protein [Empedobacter sp. GD03861]MDH0675444.1 SusC/RagA family TonB-linked outer membrane protein [Empedobacter sp. GD03861]